METPLRSTVNKPGIERAIRRDFRQNSRMRPHWKDSEFFYEHGQWWAGCRYCGAQWSVVDCVSLSGEDYFDFELVTKGDTE
jgi:hypothetical protein